MAKTSTSSVRSFGSVPEPAMPWREPFDELTRSFQDYHDLLERLLATSSEGLQGAPVCSLPPLDSQET